MIEQDLKTLLAPLVAGRWYADVTPDQPQFPLAIWQQVGGQASQYLEKRLPEHFHMRIQISIWSKSRLEANGLARDVERALIEAPLLITEAYGAFTALHNPDLKLYGTRQDFGIFYKDP